MGFHRDRETDWGKVGSILLSTIGIVFLAALCLFFCIRLYYKAFDRRPPTPKPTLSDFNARREVFVEECKRNGDIPNVGSDDANTWKCEER